MADFKNTLISCQKCGKSIAVKVRDFENGSIQCGHPGCGQVNVLTQPYYDERILQGLPEFGRLMHQANPALSYPLRLGVNVVGHSPTCEVAVERLVHEGKCYISRRHCTIKVIFDKWKGTFRYQLIDGASDPDSRQHKSSLNGTLLNGYLLQNGEKIDIGDQGVVSMGGKDFFRLEVYRIPPRMLESYQLLKLLESDETQ